MGAGGTVGCQLGLLELAAVSATAHLPMLVETLPEALQWLRWLSPSTAGIQASLRLNQMGAPLVAAAQPMLCRTWWRCATGRPCCGSAIAQQRLKK